MRSRARRWRFCAGLMLATAVLAVHAQDDVYLVSAGRLFRWNQSKPGAMPVEVRLPPAVGAVTAVAVNRRSQAFVGTGDGRIFSTDGEGATVFYQHTSRIEHLAFGSSNDVLLFSVTQPAGEISALDLRTRRIERRATLAAAAVGEWAGAFAVDLEDRIFVGTPAGRIYELRDGTPAMVFEQAGDAIRGLAAEVNSLFYVTGDGNVYQLRNLRTRSVALTRPSSAWSYVSYHPLPLSDEIKADSCELFVQVVSADTGLLNLFTPVIQGPGLNWVPASVEGNGGRTGNGIFRYFVQKGVYWVRMDTRGDLAVTVQPRNQRVVCTGTRSAATFRAMR